MEKDNANKDKIVTEFNKLKIENKELQDDNNKLGESFALKDKEINDMKIRIAELEKNIRPLIGFS